MAQGSVLSVMGDLFGVFNVYGRHVLVYVCTFNISNAYPGTRVIGDGYPGSKFTTRFQP